MTSRAQRLGLALVLAALAAVLAVRATHLLRGETLTAADERAWYGWAVRDPALAERIAAAGAERAADPRPGGTLHLVVPAGSDLRWALARAAYAFPADLPIVLHPAGEPFGTAPGSRVFDLTRATGPWRRTSLPGGG